VIVLKTSTTFFLVKNYKQAIALFTQKIYIEKDISKEQLLLTGLYLCLSKDLLVQGTVDCFFIDLCITYPNKHP